MIAAASLLEFALAELQGGMPEAIERFREASDFLGPDKDFKPPSPHPKGCPDGLE